MIGEEKKSYYPILIDLDKAPCMIVGGGGVALRKAVNLIEFSAKPTVVAPVICEGIEELAEEGLVWLEHRSYRTGDARDYKIIFSAVDDPEVDEQIRRDCADCGALFNSAGVPEKSNAIVPATIKKGPMSISVASQGSAPFFVKAMKEYIESFLPPYLPIVANLAGDFRSKVLQNGAFLDCEKKRLVYDEFLKVHWDKLLYEEGIEGAQKKILNIIDKHKSL